MATAQDLLAGLALEPRDDGTFNAPNIAYYGGSGASASSSAIADVVWGGQLLGQAIVAAALRHPDKVTKTGQLIFARGGRVSLKTTLATETVSSGRSFGAELVAFRQNDRTITQSLILTGAREADTFAHRLVADLAPPTPSDNVKVHGAFDILWVDDVVWDSPDDLGPPRIDTWMRFPAAVAEAHVHQALIAMATLPFAIGAAMRPYPGVSVGQSHIALSTGVIGHTVTFHADAAATEWFLVRHSAPYAGGGMVYGRGDVFDASGQMVASYSQDGMAKAVGEKVKGAL